VYFPKWAAMAASLVEESRMMPELVSGLGVNNLTTPPSVFSIIFLMKRDHVIAVPESTMNISAEKSTAKNESNP
jgi:hypothetical protein